MKTSVVRGVIAILLIALLAPGAWALDKVTPNEARAIAKEAYIFNYPLVLYYRTMYLQAIDKDSKSYSGGFGKWLHLGTSTPKDTDIVSPNNDTPYSYAWVDLRTEPWVLTMPKIEDNRFYTSQWDDLWGFVVGNAGSVGDGNEGVSVLLASPAWKGELPKGVKRVIRGDSEFLGTLTRTQLNDPSDLPNVKKIQKEYKPSWPYITDLRQDPYEYFNRENTITYGKWWADRIYLMVPAQQVVAEHLKSLKEFPPAHGSSLSLGKILDKIQYAKPGQ